MKYFMNARTVEKSGLKQKKKRNLTKTPFEYLEILDNKKCDVLDYFRIRSPFTNRGSIFSSKGIFPYSSSNRSKQKSSKARRCCRFSSSPSIEYSRSLNPFLTSILITPFPRASLSKTRQRKSFNCACSMASN